MYERIYELIDRWEEEWQELHEKGNKALHNSLYMLCEDYKAQAELLRGRIDELTVLVKE